MFKSKGIPEYLQKQVAEYTKDWVERRIVSATIIDCSTIRIFFRNNFGVLDCQLFPLDHNEVDVYFAKKNGNPIDNNQSNETIDETIGDTNSQNKVTTLPETPIKLQLQIPDAAVDESLFVQC